MEKINIIQLISGEEFLHKEIATAMEDERKMRILREINIRSLNNDPKKTVSIKGETYVKFSASEMRILAFEGSISEKTIRIKLAEMVNRGILKRTVLNNSSSSGNTYWYAINFTVIEKMFNEFNHRLSFYAAEKPIQSTREIYKETRANQAVVSFVGVDNTGSNSEFLPSRYKIDKENIILGLKSYKFDYQKYGIDSQQFKTIIQNIEDGIFDELIESFLSDYHIRANKSKIVNRQAHIAGSFMNLLTKGQITPTIGLIMAGITNIIISGKNIDVPFDILFCIEKELKKSNGFLDELYADFLIDFESKNKNGTICVMSDYSAISFARYVYSHRNSLNDDFFKDKSSSKNSTAKKEIKTNTQSSTSNPCNIDVFCDDENIIAPVKFSNIQPCYKQDEEFAVDYFDDAERIESLYSDTLCPPVEDEITTYYPQELIENQVTPQISTQYASDIVPVNSLMPVTRSSITDRCNQRFSISKSEAKRYSDKKTCYTIFDFPKPNIAIEYSKFSIFPNQSKQADETALC